MTCPACGADDVAFPVPAELRDFLPDDRPAATVCTRCLHVAPADDAPDDLPDFTAISDALPRDREAAAAVALALGLLGALAVHREEIDGLFAFAERRGVDPLLVVDRLARDGALDPEIDLARRRRQLEQLLD
ncbi:DUF6276 family protein [Halobacteriaceae archaeon GCM10025711]